MKLVVVLFMILAMMLLYADIIDFSLIKKPGYPDNLELSVLPFTMHDNYDYVITLCNKPTSYSKPFGAVRIYTFGINSYKDITILINNIPYNLNKNVWIPTETMIGKVCYETAIDIDIDPDKMYNIEFNKDTNEIINNPIKMPAVASIDDMSFPCLDSTYSISWSLNSRPDFLHYSMFFDNNMSYSNSICETKNNLYLATIPDSTINKDANCASILISCCNFYVNKRSAIISKTTNICYCYRQ